MRISLERQIPLAFLFAAILLVLVGFFAYRSVSALRSTIALEINAQEIIQQLDGLTLALVDAETGARGFVVTGDESFLEPQLEAGLKVGEAAERLTELFADRPEKAASVNELKTLSAEKIAIINRTIELRRTQNGATAGEFVGAGAGKAVMNRVRSIVARLKSEETTLLREREADLSRNYTQILYLVMFGSGAGIFLLALANGVILREIRRRTKAESELLASNKNLETRVENRTLELGRLNENLQTQIKKREEAEVSRQIALEAGRLGTWRWNLKTDECELDDRTLKLFGLSEDEYDGKVAAVFGKLLPEDNARVKQNADIAVADKSVYLAEFRIRLPDGAIRWLSGVGQPQYDDAGAPAFLIGYNSDITERKEYELSLESNARHLRRVIDSLYTFVGVMRPDGTLTEVNRTALDAARLTTEDVIDKHFAETYWWSYSPEVQTRLRASIDAAAGGESVRYDEVIRLGDDHFITIDFMLAPLLDDRGEVTHLIPSGLDLTPRKKIEAERELLLEREQEARREAEAASRLRDEFLATVSHELRNPLNAMLGWARLLQKDSLDAANTAKAVATIVRNAEAQNRLVEDLLDVSRIISGKMRLDIATIAPESFVEAAVETVRPAAEAKNIQIHTAFGDSLNKISGDASRLQQVVWNLLANAIKFTPKGGEVFVRLDAVDSMIEIKVRDTGAGISADFLPHVFDRFRQADASTVRQYGGLGLGLAIVRHIVEMHGGTVSAESAGEGKGATFTVLLPVSALEVEAEQIGSIGEIKNIDFGSRSIANLSGLKILTVDDETDTRDLIERVLTDCGAIVKTAPSAAEAFAEYQKQKPDIIVSDIGMPEEDGYSLIRRVRAAENGGKPVPAIALTAFARPQDRMQALAAGFQTHLSKPVEPEELVTVIASLTGRLAPNNQ